MAQLLRSIATVVMTMCMTAALAQSPAKNIDELGRAKLAEIIAFVRLASEACPHAVPDAWGFEALALLFVVKPPLEEQEIVAKEKEVKQFRVRLGQQKWCQLYAVEMEEAHIVMGAATSPGR